MCVVSFSRITANWSRILIENEICIPCGNTDFHSAHRHFVIVILGHSDTRTMDRAQNSYIETIGIFIRKINQYFQADESKKLREESVCVCKCME